MDPQICVCSSKNGGKTCSPHKNIELENVSPHNMGVDLCPPQKHENWICDSPKKIGVKCVFTPKYGVSPRIEGLNV